MEFCDYDYVEGLNPIFLQPLGMTSLKSISEVTELKQDPRYLMYPERVADTGFVPAKLNKEALDKGLNKYCRNNWDINMTAMKKAESFLFLHFENTMCDSDIILDYNEIITQMDCTTSPGPGYSKFSSDKRGILLNPGFKNWFDRNVSYIENNWKYGNPVPVFFTASLKDEKRPREKVEANKTRVFTAGSMDLTFIGLKYLYHMNKKMHEGHGKLHSKVGINCFNGNWNLLYEYLSSREKFKKGLSLDVSNWDASFRQMAFAIICEFRFRMLKSEYQTQEIWNLFCCYYGNIVKSCCIDKIGRTFFKLIGNCSGQPSTAEDNTLGLFLVFAYIFVLFNPNATYKEFLEEWNMALYGDDNTLVVKDGLEAKYPISKITNHGLDYGMEFVSQYPDYQKLELLEFLSKSFVKVGPYYGFTMDKNKIFSILEYTKHLEIELALNKAVSALELSFNDKDTYEYVKQYINYLDCFPEAKNNAAYLQIRRKVLNDKQMYLKHFFSEDVVNAVEFYRLAHPGYQL